MTEKELEKLFKSKLGSASYEFNPAAWSAMENLLDQKATRGGAYFWRSAAAILLFGMLAASVTFWQTGQDLPSSPNLVAPSTEQPLQEPLETIDEPTVNPDVTSSIAETEASEQQHDAAITSDEPEAEKVADEFAANSNTPSSVGPAPPQDATTPALGISSNELSVMAVSQKEEQELLGLKAKTPHYSNHISAGAIQAGGILPSPRKAITRQGLYLKGGTILNEAYNTGDMGVGFHLGFEYQVGFARNLEFSAGLNYSRINKVGIHQEFDSTFYHFSSDRIETEITGRQLSYLELPVSLNWRFHPRHQIGAGAYAALMLSVSEDIEKRHYRQGTEMAVSKSVDEGKLSPYEDYDFGLGCHYFFMIDHQLELGLEFRYGLTDITRDTEGVYGRNHQNMNTRISLRYRII
jgi:hypothetical protein